MLRLISYQTDPIPSRSANRTPLPPENSTATLGATSSRPTSSQKDQTAGPLRPICELWDEAYHELKEKEEDLINNYEAILKGDIGMGFQSTVMFSGFNIERPEHMARL